ncbi:hypothetical protein CB433_04670 [Salmonella enterica subsp. enterica serovar Newport]|nr:hypothetical protein [Salmonella enterica subsp. enterica serovar Newport]
MASRVIERKVLHARGVSLIEMIFVLIIIGLIMSGLAVYANKLMNESMRQTEADAIAQEISGILQFVNSDNINMSVGGGAYQSKPNPLYAPDIGHNPVYLAKQGANYQNTGLTASGNNVSPYISRTYSYKVNSSIASPGYSIVGPGNGESQSLKWSEALWGKDSVRKYFTDSICDASASNPVYFSQQYLSCSENPVLANSELSIPRVDFINAKGTQDRNDPDSVPLGVSRVDVFVQYVPKEGDPRKIEQFVTPLMNAFRAKKITPNPDAIYVVLRVNQHNNVWGFLSNSGSSYVDMESFIVNGIPEPVVNGVQQIELIKLSALPDYIARKGLNKNNVYGIRFSFDGGGDYLRTDGLNSAKKVCWNTVNNTQGPCLESPSQDLLVLHQRNQQDKLADMQMRNVILQGTNNELYTAPQTQYFAFGNRGLNPAPTYLQKSEGGSGSGYDTCVGIDQSDKCIKGNAPSPDDLANKGNGAILLPVQTCPVADSQQLYPRLSVSVSSLISGIPVDGASGNTGKWDEGYSFDKSSENLTGGGTSSPALGNMTLNRLGGVIFNITHDADTVPDPQWHIASVVATEGIDNDVGSKLKRSWQYYNPAWLSVVVSTWCSSVPQT